ncbi:MAG TPA: hypothetical protein VEU72_06610 [Nitrosopumilaceae archaeon]|nr:hypothetical protein [Nitrosopumilaceae archaeon]
MTDKISIEEMKKVIERYGSERKILSQSKPTDEKIIEMYNWIMERDKNRDVETVRRLHEYIEKKRRMGEFAKNLQVKK